MRKKYNIIISQGIVTSTRRATLLWWPEDLWIIEGNIIIIIITMEPKHL